MIKVSKIDDYINKYIFGSPIDTDAVVLKDNDYKTISKDEISYLKIDENESLIYKLEKDDIVYGLGENVRGLNKRGWIYESFCTDEYSHTPDKKSLYGAHNFLIIYGEKCFGIFIDSPSKVTFDVGFTDYNELKISLENKNYNLYTIKGDSPKEIVKEFRKLIGTSYVAPKWAFGYGQSKWGYRNESQVRDILKKFKEHDIPIEMLYLDLDYMDNFKDFSTSKESFPNFDEFISECKKDGVKVIPIIDAGVKIEEGYDIYEEGIKNGYFCVDKDGKPFVAAVWPGKVHFPDFLNKNARKWFGSKYKFLVDKGIEGFWNDMNEPSIFYTEKRVEEAFEEAEKIRKTNINIHNYFALKDYFNNLANSIDDYKSFYHNIDGKMVNHYDVHNLYGYNMTRAASEGLDTIDENKRFLLFSRGSSIGMQRYSGIWTGDSCSWWEHIELTLKMLPSLNMCGFMYVGSDTGGFSVDTTSDLLIRWNGLSVFTPLFRNHTSQWSRTQEPFAFDDETTKIIRNILKFRYSLIPYLYSEYMKSIRDNEMYFSPLSFEYKDEYVDGVEDQLLVGDSLMISPIYKQNAKGRYVYLPEEMLFVTLDSDGKFNYKVMEKGHQYIDYKIDEICFFLRKDRILPLVNTANKVSELSIEELHLVAFVGENAKYELYDDDGITKDYKKGICSDISISINLENNEYRINLSGKGSEDIKVIEALIFDPDGKMHKISKKI